AIFFMSLLNSSSTRYLIESQVVGASVVRRFNLEPIPLGYMIVGQSETAVSKVGVAKPVPFSKIDLATDYALAAQYLGMRFVYLEAGSGAEHMVDPRMVSKVSEKNQCSTDSWRWNQNPEPSGTTSPRSGLSYRYGNGHRARRTRTGQADIASPETCLTDAARSKEWRVRDSRRFQLHQTSRLPHYPSSDRDFRRNCASIGINLATTVKRESSPDIGVRGGDTGMAGGPRRISE